MASLRTQFLILMLLLANLSHALEPCTTSSESYIQRFEELVVQSIPEKFVLAADVYPAFRGEWSVRIVKKDGEFLVKLVQFEESLWYASHSEDGDMIKQEFSSTSVDSKTHASPVTPEFAAKLEDEWNHSIAQVRESDRVGSDGVSYRFRLPDGSCGKAWSPNPLSRNFLLVGMADRLRDIALLESRMPAADLEDVVSKVLDELKRIR